MVGADNLVYLAKYEEFYIDDEVANYTLHVDGYHGNAGQ
jgi:hypothetical protein